jgi:hypothetical protein
VAVNEPDSYQKSKLVALRVMGGLCCLQGAMWWILVRSDHAAHLTTWVVYDIVASLATVAYGIISLIRAKRLGYVWGEMAMPIVFGLTSIRTPIQGIKNGDITFDGAIGLLLVGACLVMVVLSRKIARAEAGLGGDKAQS